MSRFHRDIMTRKCPEIARVPTTEGMNASTEASYLPPNVYAYGTNKAKRVLKKIGERTLSRRWFSKASSDTGMIHAVKQAPQFQLAVCALKETGISTRSYL